MTVGFFVCLFILSKMSVCNLSGPSCDLDLHSVVNGFLSSGNLPVFKGYLGFRGNDRVRSTWI